MRSLVDLADPPPRLAKEPPHLSWHLLAAAVLALVSSLTVNRGFKICLSFRKLLSSLVKLGDSIFSYWLFCGAEKDK